MARHQSNNQAREARMTYRSAAYAGTIYGRYELEQHLEKSLTRSKCSSRTCIVHEIFIRVVSQHV